MACQKEKRKKITGAREKVEENESKRHKTRTTHTWGAATEQEEIDAVGRFVELAYRDRKRGKRDGKISC